MKKDNLEAIEQFEAFEATWDDTNPLRAKVVLIRPGTNLSGTREWSAKALREASESGFWDNTRMFVDHQVDKNKLPSKVVNRSLRDMVSAVESTDIGPGGEVIGDVVFLDETFAKFARNAQKYMGPSVNLLFSGQVIKRDGKRFEVVESLEHNKSIDWVVFPGAGGAIQEFYATEGEDDVEWSEVTAEMLREHRPDLVEAFEAAAMPPTDDKEADVDVKQYLTREDIDSYVKGAIREARESWDQEQAAKDAAKEQYAERVRKSGLPNKTQNRIMSAFVGVYDEKTVDTLIKEAREELEDAGVKPQVRGLGVSTSSDDSEKKRSLKEISPLHQAMESAFSVPNKEG